MYSTADVASRLRELLEAIEWAVGEIPAEYHHKLPDFYAPGEWHAAMNLAHLVVYEEQLANPVVEALAGGGTGVEAVQSGLESWSMADAIKASEEQLNTLLERFATARATGISIVCGWHCSRRAR